MMVAFFKGRRKLKIKIVYIYSINTHQYCINTYIMNTHNIHDKILSPAHHTSLQSRESNTKYHHRQMRLPKHTFP